MKIEMTAATAACTICDGLGVVGIRTCGHRGNCPCGFEERECICVLRGWAMAAVMQEALTEDDEVLKQEALDMHERIKNGEEDEWLVGLIDQYESWKRGRAQAARAARRN